MSSWIAGWLGEDVAVKSGLSVWAGRVSWEEVSLFQEMNRCDRGGGLVPSPEKGQSCKWIHLPEICLSSCHNILNFFGLFLQNSIALCKCMQGKVLFEEVLMCLYTWACHMCVGSRVCTCMYGARGQTWMLLLRFCLHGLCNRISHGAWLSKISLGHVASKPHGPACLCLPITSVVSKYHHAHV